MTTTIVALNDPTVGFAQPDRDWIAPSRLRPLFHDDPGIIWLEQQGADFGFAPDTSPYAFLDFIAEKGHQFEAAWIARKAPGAPQVCLDPREARLSVKVHETLDLMALGEPVIVQPALWWPEERLYGAPDLIARRSWIVANLPALAPLLGAIGSDDHYMVLDLKFTSHLDEGDKKHDMAFYEAQVRLYRAMLAQIQKAVPAYAFLITRDRISEPLEVAVNMALGADLPADIAQKCAHYRDIKRNGASYTPSTHRALVGLNAKRREERWHTAKKIITRERVAGGALDTLYYVGAKAAAKLEERGYTCVADLLALDPATLDLDKTGVRQRQLRAILGANRSGAALPPPATGVPARRRYEFYVDFEFFSNVNVDFERQWPGLEGCEMIFMAGVGWEEAGAWHERQFVAVAESQAAERELLEALIGFLWEQTEGKLCDSDATALYHWSHAEKTQVGSALRRHGLPEEHLLARLPWVDLCTVCEGSACGIPGAWGYGLKEVARALGRLDPTLDPHWPTGLGDGLAAQVMGWHSFRHPDPLSTSEMVLLSAYLSADCRALQKVLLWMRR